MSAKSDAAGEPGPLACYCNNVPQHRVIQAIESGAAKNLTEIYDCTGAGTGPCGGSCRPVLINLLNLNRKSGDETAAPSTSKAPPPELIEGISLFNRRFFWEAHEVWEHKWKDCEGIEKLFYQGLIQAAATYYHVLGGNPKGVVRLASAAHEKLAKVPLNYLDVHVGPIMEKLHLFEQHAKDVLGGTSAGFDFDQIPQISFHAQKDK